MNAIDLTKFAARICVVLVCGFAPASLCPIAAGPPDFTITSGLVHHQLLQRDGSDRATAQVAGHVNYTAAAAVEARVLRRHVAVAGLDWAKVSAVSGVTWRAAVPNLPVGGPYDLQFRVVDPDGAVLATLDVHDVLVGDIWVLAGQSNMVGNGRLVDLETPHELVRNFNPRDEWQIAEEPLHSLAESIDEAHWGNAGHLTPLWATKPGERATGPLEGEARARFRRNRQHGAGLALTFAKQMVEQTGVPVGLVPCAHGGTSVGQWDPALQCH